MKFARWAPGLAALALGGMLLPGAAAATPRVKGPPAAPHTQVISGDLSSLSCATSSVCFAISIGNKRSEFGVMRIADGGVSAQLTRINENFFFDDLSCPSSAGCGLLESGPPSYRPQVVRVSIDGVIGKPTFVGSSSAKSQPDHLACFPTRRHCTAVGASKHLFRVVALDGTKTHTHDLHLPSTITIGSIDAVSCPSASRCFAVGQVTVSGQSAEDGLVVPIRDGVPAPPVYVADASAGGFIAIACPSADKCYAIGFAASGQAAYLVLDTLRRGRLTHSVALPRLDDLEAVACESVHLCYAVGSDGKKGAIFPIRDGKLGKVQTTSVTQAYGTGLNQDAVAAFDGGIEILGLDHRHVNKTVVSSS